MLLISVLSTTLMKRPTCLVVSPDDPLKYLAVMTVYYMEVVGNPMVP